MTSLRDAAQMALMAAFTFGVMLVLVVMSSLDGDLLAAIGALVLTGLCFAGLVLWALEPER
jgi:hypothetical protein